MRHLFKLFLLGALLLALGNGAPQISNNETSVIESGAGKNCTEVTFKTVFSCIYVRFQKLENVWFKKKERISELWKFYGENVFFGHEETF